MSIALTIATVIVRTAMALILAASIAAITLLLAEQAHHIHHSIKDTQ